MTMLCTLLYMMFVFQGRVRLGATGAVVTEEAVTGVGTGIGVQMTDIGDSRRFKAQLVMGLLVTIVT